MSNELGIGKVIVQKVERDAIHVAVLPCVCARAVVAGENVWLDKKPPTSFGWHPVVLTGGPAWEAKADWVGVVDPFLKDPVPPGVGFWVFLRPGTAVSLRHHYRFPALDGDAPADDVTPNAGRWEFRIVDKNFATRTVAVLAGDEGAAWMAIMENEHFAGAKETKLVRRGDDRAE